MKNKNKYSIKVTPTVYDVDGNVKHVYPTHPNLILDEGLDLMVKQGPMAVMTYFHCGTGTATVNRQSSTGIISRNGNTVTATSSFFEISDVGRVIQFDDNTDCRITNFTSDTSVEVADSGILSNVTCIVWYTDQTGLATWYKASTTPDLTDPNNNGTNFTVQNEGVVDAAYLEATTYHTRKIIMNDDVTITEAGWSNSSSSTSRLMGRIQFDTPIPLLTNETLALKVTLHRVLWEHGSITSDPLFGQPGSWSGDYLNPTTQGVFGYVDATTGAPTSPSSKLFAGESNGTYYDYWQFYNDTGGSDTHLMDDTVTYVNGSYKFDMPVGEITVLGGKTLTNYNIINGNNSGNINPIVFTFDTPFEVPDDALLNLTYSVHLGRTLPDFPV